MAETHPRLNFVRRTLLGTLCYLLVLQTFSAAFNTAAAADQTDRAVTSIICHSPRADTPANGDPAKQPSVPCALCAIAASAVLIATAGTVVATPLAVHDFVAGAKAPAIAPPPFARAGLSRAPPQLT